jgi:hypothetical protein
MLLDSYKGDDGDVIEGHDASAGGDEIPAISRRGRVGGPSRRTPARIKGHAYSNPNDQSHGSSFRYSVVGIWKRPAEASPLAICCVVGVNPSSIFGGRIVEDQKQKQTSAEVVRAAKEAATLAFANRPVAGLPSDKNQRT